MATFVMAAIFRTTAAVTQTASQAMAGAGVLVLILVIYTGFVIRIPEMPVYFGWIRWINVSVHVRTAYKTSTNFLSLRVAYFLRIRDSACKRIPRCQLPMRPIHTLGAWIQLER